MLIETRTMHGAHPLIPLSSRSFSCARNADTHTNRWRAGGGWCYGADPNSTKSSCAGRGGFHWPPHASLVDTDGRVPPSTSSSGRVGSSDADYGGVMAQDPDINPDFHTWNKVFIHYCDGASMGSSRTDPIPVSDNAGKPALMWMRGDQSTDLPVVSLVFQAKLDAR
jgi:hypothetical protein